MVSHLNNMSQLTYKEILEIRDFLKQNCSKEYLTFDEMAGLLGSREKTKDFLEQYRLLSPGSYNDMYLVMKCPSCGEEVLSDILHNFDRRQSDCKSCGHKFTSLETEKTEVRLYKNSI